MRSTWILGPLVVGAGLARGQDLEPTVHTVDTELRTLGDCPRKHVITSAEAYARVVRGLAGAPPAPDFSTQHVALLVFDRGAGGDPELGAVSQVDGVLSVSVVRRDTGAPRGALRCVFLEVPSFTGGVELAQRRELDGEQGFVEKTLAPTPADRLEPALPELGPDLELSWEAADGKPLPVGLKLLHQVRFLKQPGLDKRSTKSDVAGDHTSARFPALQLDVEHLYAVYVPGRRPLRSRNPLRITTQDLGGVNAKNPPRIRHRFVLEVVPGH